MPANTRNNRRPPPVETRWKPGQSGNPSGRPAKKPLTVELEALMPKRCPLDRRGRTWVAVLAEALATSAAKGKPEAFRELADRLEGRVAHAVEVTAPVQPEGQLDETIVDLLSRAPELLAKAQSRRAVAGGTGPNLLPPARDGEKKP